MSDAHAELPKLTADNTRLASGSLWRKFPLIGIVLGLGCLGAAWFVGTSPASAHAKAGHTQFFFSYLTALMFWLAVALGCFFFVLIQHGTRAGWSIVVRRIAENWMMVLPAFAVLIVPVIFGMHELFHWSHAEVVKEDLLLSRKQAFLDPTFFTVRAFVLVGLWSLFGYMLYRWSRKQDTTGDPKLSHKMRWWAPIGFVLFALTTTVAAIDWMMSLDPHWYSTIFGVYYFAGAVMAGGAAITLSALALQKSGVLKNAISLEHYQDLGKWTFAFMVFWAYMAVSQFLLIWYANIPEETVFFGTRMEGGWDFLSVFMPLAKFGVPFWLLMSKHVKRSRVALALGAGWLLFAQYLDIFWLVQPNMALVQGHEAHFSIHIADLLCLVGIGGILVGVFAWLTTRSPTAPVGDPRLSESLRFENM